MNMPHGNPGRRIAQAVRDFEERHTHHGREWVAVFLNEKTIVIAVHGSATAAERTPAGYPQGSESQRQRFASTDLLRTIERIGGMSVLDTTVEVDPTTGGVVLLFTTDTAGTDVPLATGRPAGKPERVRPEGGSRRANKPPGCVIRV